VSARAAERREKTLSDPFVKNSTLVAPSAFFASGFHQNGNMESDAFGWSEGASLSRMSCQGDAIAREHVNKSTHTSTSAACAALCVEKTCVLCAGGEIKSGDA
jgi:hypothetical protein